MEESTILALEQWSDIIANAVTIFGIVAIWISIKQYLSKMKEKEFEKIEKEKEILAQSFQNRYELYAEMDKILVEKPHLKKLISNQSYLKDYEAGLLAGKEEDLAFIEMVLNICQLSFFQFKNERNNSGLNWVKELLENKYIIDYWKSGYRCRYTNDFEGFVENEINKNN